VGVGDGDVCVSGGFGDGVGDDIGDTRIDKLDLLKNFNL